MYQFRKYHSVLGRLFWMENRFELVLKQVRFELLQKIDSQEPENTLNTFG